MTNLSQQVSTEPASYSSGSRVAKKCRFSPQLGPPDTLRFHVMDMRSKVALEQFQMDVRKEHTTLAIWNNLVKIHETYPNGGAVYGGVKMFSEMNDLTMIKSGIVPTGSTIDEVKDLFDQIMVMDNMLFDDPKYPVSLQEVDFMVSILPGMKDRRF